MLVNINVSQQLSGEEQAAKFLGVWRAAGVPGEVKPPGLLQSSGFGAADVVNERLGGAFWKQMRQEETGG